MSGNLCKHPEKMTREANPCRSKLKVQLESPGSERTVLNVMKTVLSMLSALATIGIIINSASQSMQFTTNNSQ